MSRTDDIFQAGNPFPFSPVVQLGAFTDDVRTGSEPAKRPETVATGSLTRVREQVAEYFAQRELGGGRGRAIALVGELGMGKSHLAREVAADVRSRSAVEAFPPPLWVINEPSIAMGSIYRNRMMSLRDDRNRRTAFEQVVSHYRADVTANLVEADDSRRFGHAREQLVTGLRDRSFDPQKVEQAIDLDRELIHRNLVEHLRLVTDHRGFAAALALLLEGPYNREVWDWLTGDPPSRSLIERGVFSSIDVIEGVFDALAVFGFLHGRVGKPYVLVLDALEYVLDWPSDSYNAFINGFEMLVNTYVNQGGLLVFCIRPEPWSRLPRSLHERVLQIWPTRFEHDECSRLVRAHVRTLPAATLQSAGFEDPQHASYAPFTTGAINAVAELSDGVPRQALRVCHQSWKLAAASDAHSHHIDADQVRVAVRQLHEQRDIGEVLHSLEKTLTDGQWRRELNPPELADVVSEDVNAIAYWLRVDVTSAIGILLVSSVLAEADVHRIVRVTRTVRRAFSAGICEVLVISNGHVPRTMRNRVAQAIGTAPLAVGDASFSERLARALDVLAARMEAARQRTALDTLRTRLSTMAVQQGEVLQRIDRLDGQVERLGTATQPGPATPASGTPVPAGMALPPSVDRLFTVAREALDLLTGVESTTSLRQALGVDVSGMAQLDGRPQRVAFTLEQFQTLGITALLRQLLDGFRDGIAGWLRTVAATTGPVPTAAQENSLFIVCRSFEITFEVLPPIRAELLPGARATQEQGARTVRRTLVGDVFGRLAEEVQRAVLREVNGENGSGAREEAVR
ncbi:hypothetical protein ABZ348_23850 [Streptomyces sp. NPDC005963]|uniref:hypothetical protein n=1 Tax=Streptomyces sp. NPDC005963 TaxID=3156721 RepID=UPI0033DDBFE0